MRVRGHVSPWIEAEDLSELPVILLLIRANENGRSSRLRYSWKLYPCVEALRRRFSFCFRGCRSWGEVCLKFDLISRATRKVRMVRVRRRSIVIQLSPTMRSFGAGLLSDWGDWLLSEGRYSFCFSARWESCDRGFRKPLLFYWLMECLVCCKWPLWGTIRWNADQLTFRLGVFCLPWREQSS